MLPESKKKFGTNAVNGGGSGCSGDSFLVRLLAFLLAKSQSYPLFDFFKTRPEGRNESKDNR